MDTAERVRIDEAQPGLGTGPGGAPRDEPGACLLAQPGPSSRAIVDGPQEGHTSPTPIERAVARLASMSEQLEEARRLLGAA
jgi:hypothetical protein